jgi:hypothetical protein
MYHSMTAELGTGAKRHSVDFRARLTCVVSIMILLFSMDQEAHSTNLIVGWVSARFEVLLAVLLRIQVLWDMAMCRWVRLGS